MFALQWNEADDIAVKPGRMRKPGIHGGIYFMSVDEVSFACLLKERG
jgi:hypothetical protein